MLLYNAQRYQYSSYEYERVVIQALLGHCGAKECFYTMHSAKVSPVHWLLASWQAAFLV